MNMVPRSMSGSPDPSLCNRFGSNKASPCGHTADLLQQSKAEMRHTHTDTCLGLSGGTTPNKDPELAARRESALRAGLGSTGTITQSLAPPKHAVCRRHRPSCSNESQPRSAVEAMCGFLSAERPKPGAPPHKSLRELKPRVLRVVAPDAQLEVRRADGVVEATGSDAPREAELRRICCLRTTSLHEQQPAQPWRSAWGSAPLSTLRRCRAAGLRPSLKSASSPKSEAEAPVLVDPRALGDNFGQQTELPS